MADKQREGSKDVSLSSGVDRLFDFCELWSYLRCIGYSRQAGMSSFASRAEKEFAAIADVLELQVSDERIKLDDDFLFALEISLELEGGLDAVKEGLFEILDPSCSGHVSRVAWKDFSDQLHASGKSLVEFVTRSVVPPADDQPQTPQPTSGLPAAEAVGAAAVEPEGTARRQVCVTLPE